MKDLRVRRPVRDLTLTLAIAFSIILAGFGSASAGKTAPVQIGFVGVPPTEAPYQNVLLNVQAIRINPKPNAAPNDPKWQRIGVPAGIGQGGGSTAVLQIDLNNSQNLPQLFNTAKVKPGTYKIAQLILDANNPGTIIPDCPLAGTPEGCINYPIQLTNAGNPINLISTTQPLLSPTNGALTQLIIQLAMHVDTKPIQPGAPYLVTIKLAQITTPSTGEVKGANIPGGSGGTTKHLRKLEVIAEPIGTNTQIASAPVSKGKYDLMLPAAGGPIGMDFGTLYDLALGGGGDSFGAIRLSSLIPGQTIFPPDFTGILTNQTLGSITGTITDACNGQKITGATIQLLLPPQNTPSVTAADCIDPVNFRDCVSVATATTDNAGLFPLPGTLTLPSVFETIPIVPSGNTLYSMMITAPGYDPAFTLVNATSGTKGGNCSANKAITPCNFKLTRGTISGSFQVVAPIAGQTILMQVFAEDAGTNNIVSALPTPVIVRSTSGTAFSFTINVPTQPPGRMFDLFATAIDTFQGISDPYQGHTIGVIKDVAGPPAPGATCNDASAGVSLNTVDCVGHGSITGSVPHADLGTSVALLKDGVLITNAPVQNTLPNPLPSNAYSFCAPGDTYTVQQLQLPKPVQSETPLAAPTPSLTPPVKDATIPLAPHVGGPAPTPTPGFKCPTTCSNPSDGTCPGICNNVGVTIE